MITTLATTLGDTKTTYEYPGESVLTERLPTHVRVLKGIACLPA
jgi:hypothetical protein